MERFLENVGEKIVGYHGNFDRTRRYFIIAIKKSFSTLAGWLKYSETNLRNLLIYEIEGTKKDTDRNKVFFETRNIIALLSENPTNGKNEKLYS